MKKLMVIICGLFFFPFKLAHASQSKNRNPYNIRICSYYAAPKGNGDEALSDTTPITTVDMNLNGTTSRKSAAGIFADWTHVADVYGGISEIVHNSAILADIGNCVEAKGFKNCTGSRDLKTASGGVEFALGESFVSTMRRMAHQIATPKRRARMSQMLAAMVGEITNR
jgi:hypothetical protein